jgi:hypothetical protein
MLFELDRAYWVNEFYCFIIRCRLYSMKFRLYYEPMCPSIASIRIAINDLNLIIK